MATKKKHPHSTPSTPSSAADRSAAIQEALAKIQKDYGDEAVMDLTDANRKQIRGIPTGSLALDLALGGKGLPRGRVVELYGPESSGKSTLAMSVVAQAQKMGGFALYVDAEHAFDPEYAMKLGVQIQGDRFLLSQPTTGEEGLDIAEQFIRSGAVDVVVVDSVAALVPKAEVEGEVGDQFVGLQARMMSQALRRLTAIVGKSDAVVIFINQLREKIGVMFGNPETTPGGRALKFYSSVRIDVRRIGALKNGDRIVGNRTKATVVKNKVAPPFRRAEFDILYDEGLSLEGDVLDLGMQYGFVKKSGAWFSYLPEGADEVRLGQGREAARRLLKENPDLCDEVAARVKEAILAEQRAAAPPPPAAASGVATKSTPKAQTKAKAKETEAGAAGKRTRK